MLNCKVIHGMMAAATEIKKEHKLKEAFERGWNVIVWNDHVNLMSYVTHVFRQVFGFDDSTARKHMMEVHVQGKSCVATETREKAELYWQRLQEYGLRTTLQKAQ